MRFCLLILLTAVCCTACESDPPSAAADSGVMAKTDALEKPSLAPAAPPEKALTPLEKEEAALASIREYYADVRAKLVAGTLRKDSLVYNCDGGFADGQLNFYRDANKVVMALHASSMGDHGSQTEEYYLRDGELIFFYRETGTWRFGGPMTELDDGTEVPGTIDEVTEERFYLSADTLLKALTKSYVLESWSEPETEPRDLPNRVEKDPRKWTGAVEMVRKAIREGEVNCELLDH